MIRAFRSSNFASYFGGLTQEEIAAVCELHVNTVARDLRLSEAWLRTRLRAEA